MKEALILGGALVAFAGIVLNESGKPDAPDTAAPSQEGAQEPSSFTHVSSSNRPGKAQKLSLSHDRATELARSGDGHFYAVVQVNGRPTRFMIDTGATGIALTGSDAQALELQWTYNDLSIVAQGASGPVQGVRKRLDSVALDGHEVRGLEAIIVPEGLGISLLGQSFLSTISPVRIEDDRMILGDSSRW